MIHSDAEVLAAARMLDATSTPIKETHRMPNYLSECELNAVKGLLHYLNENMNAGGTATTVEARLIDGNGDSLGTVKMGYGLDFYVLEFPS